MALLRCRGPAAARSGRDRAAQRRGAAQAWFCPLPNGHVLATGIDEKGRKQYRYHPDFRAAREAEKFDSCAAFGHRLPRLRARVTADLARPALSLERAVASVVRLLDTGTIRVGN